VSPSTANAAAVVADAFELKVAGDVLITTSTTEVDVASSMFCGAPSMETSIRSSGLDDFGHGTPNLIAPPDLQGWARVVPEVRMGCAYACCRRTLAESARRRMKIAKQTAILTSICVY
jgi:hypothetical protein